MKDGTTCTGVHVSHILLLPKLSHMGMNKSNHLQ